MLKIALFLLMIYLVAFVGFWLLGLLYGSFFRRPAVYFPAQLAAQMAAVGLAGSLLLGVGGVVLATVVMDRAFARRDDYQQLPTRIAAAVMAIAVLSATFFTTYWLAWSIFE
jgi:hypothetical protein